MTETMPREVKDSPHIQGADPLEESSLAPSPPLFIPGGLLCAQPVPEFGALTWINLHAQEDRQVNSQASGRVVRRDLEG